MKLLCLFLLTLSLVGETTSFFGRSRQSRGRGRGRGRGRTQNFGFITVNNFMGRGVHIRGHAVGAVVDPFGIWRPVADDHGHSTDEVEKCAAIADIIFVFDTSGSMNAREFDLSRKFAIRVSEHFEISANDVRVGSISFSERAKLQFRLSDYKDSQSLIAALSRTEYFGGGTKTYNALDLIRTNDLFSVSNGARAKSSKIAIVITDGASDSLYKTRAAADALKRDGIKVVSIGIGFSSGDELSAIASNSRNVFTADNFLTLTNIEQRVARRICEIPAAEGNIPSGSGSEGATCQSGFEQNPADPSKCIDIDECATEKACEQECINTIPDFRCACKDGFSVDPTDSTKCKAVISCPTVSDILFVIDASGSIGSDNFKTQQNFISKLTKHFSVSKSGARFGALLYSTDATVLFNLNTYKLQSEISSAIQNAPYLTGVTYTHKALDLVYVNKMFSEEAGGRDDAQNVVMVITDGMATDKDKANKSATRLKDAGVRIVCVGVSDQVDVDELASLASSSDDVLVVSEFNLLDYIETQLSERLCRK